MNDKDIRESLISGELKVPEMVWDNIEKGITPKKKKRAAIIWWFSGIATFAIIGFSLFLSYYGQDSGEIKNNEMIVSEGSTTRIKKETDENEDVKRELYFKQKSLEDKQLKVAPKSGKRGNKKLSAAPKNMTLKNTILKTGSSQEKNRTAFQSNSKTLKDYSKTPKADLIKTKESIAIETNIDITEEVDKKNINFKPDDNIVDYNKTESTILKENADNSLSPSLNVIDSVVHSPKPETEPIPEMAKNETDLLKIESKPNSEITKQNIPVDSLSANQKSIAKNVTAKNDSIKTSKEDTIYPEKNIKKEVSENPIVLKKNSDSKEKKFNVKFAAGYSIYALKMWDKSFLVGALSKRSFKSTGFELSGSFGYAFSKWLNPEISIAYNLKETAFSYAALYDDRGYLDYNLNGNLLELEQLNNDDNSYFCNRHLLEGINANFTIKTVALSIENYFSVWNRNKFSVSLSLGLDLAISSKIDNLTISKINVTNNLSHGFDTRINSGILVNQKITERLSLFIRPKYIFSPNNDTHFFRRGISHEIIYNGGIQFYF